MLSKENGRIMEEIRHSMGESKELKLIGSHDLNVT